MTIPRKQQPKPMAQRVKDRERAETERIREVGDRARANGSSHTDPNVVVRWVEPTREPDPKRRKRRYL